MGDVNFFKKRKESYLDSFQAQYTQLIAIFLRLFFLYGQQNLTAQKRNVVVCFNTFFKSAISKQVTENVHLIQSIQVAGVPIQVSLQSSANTKN